MSVWLHSLDGVDEDRPRRLRGALHAAGVDTCHHEWSCCARHGVLIVDRIDRATCAFLGESKLSGSSRTLVVTLASDAKRSVWTALESGASDVVTWSDGPWFVDDVVARLERWRTIEDLVQSPLVQGNLVGKSRAWAQTLEQIVEIARFTSAAVLVTGASGTGKELVARLVHTLDGRPRKGSLIVLDCTTVVPELSGSEFFGHERGAFTGAVGARDGAFALANGGTLFLDEVGELPQTLQAELLRVVQEQTYKRVGGNTWHKTEFRLVSASNRELLPAAAPSHFRPDLYYRLASWTCRLPSLGERPDDIPLLAAHFVRQASPKDEAPAISDDVLDYLMTRSYPGNIRELKQVVSRMVYRHVGRGPISAGDIPPDERRKQEPSAASWRNEQFDGAIRQAVAMRATMREISRAAEDAAVRIAVGEANGSLSRAAARLGVTGRALQMRRAAWRHAPVEEEAAD